MNPALPLGLGTCSGFITVLLTSTIQNYVNRKGILDTHATIANYLIPSLAGGIVSAVVHATNPGNVTDSNGTVVYQTNRDPTKSNFGQGGMQMAGLGVTLGIALIAGILIGLLFKLINKNHHTHQFIDKSYYEGFDKDD